MIDTIAAWRARGDHRFDPVRFRVIEALARRAAAHDGAVGRLLDERLSALLRAYGQDVDGSLAAVDTDAPATQPERGALGELLMHLDRQLPPTPDGELKALAGFRATWSRLGADRRLRQSLARVPGNAGPLNSHHLVHRALTLMRELSPPYLERFMSYVDTLSWLDQARVAGAVAPKGSPRAEGNGKRARGKPG